MSSGEQKAKRWRPWQFSLKTLLLLTMFVASFFGGWQAHVWYLDWQYRTGRILAPVTIEILDGIEGIHVIKGRREGVNAIRGRLNGQNGENDQESNERLIGQTPHELGRLHFLGKAV